MTIGRELRKKTPRRQQAFYDASRQRDPLGILREQNRSRVQKLIPVRNARMLASPFGFFRGSAAIMASDLAATPSTGLNVAACGDMHVANFGVFASAERQLVFAINDFDEIHPGPWEWDVKRLAASAVLAVRHMGGDDAAGKEAAQTAIANYREHIRQYSEMGFLEVWYDQIEAREIIQGLPKRFRPGAERLVRRASARGHLRTLDRLTEEVRGERRILEDLPLVTRERTDEDGTPIKAALDAMLKSYFRSIPDDRKRMLSRYRIVDVARKVVGVGSVGTSCWVVMLQGADSADPLFLQVKQALPSVLAQYHGSRIPFDNQGRRVVIGQRMTQGSPDIFLGWGHNGRRHFYVRQLADMKGGVRFEEGDRSGIDGFTAYCGLCGWALALAHAKSGDSAMIAGYCGRGEVLDEALAEFAVRYADQAWSDHALMLAEARKGHFPQDLDAVA